MDRDVMRSLFLEKFGEKPETIEALPPSGSHRKYFRLRNGNVSAMAVYNDDLKENIAFLEFTLHFHQAGLRVPEIYIISEDQHYYLLEDLGDISLKHVLDESRTDNGVSPQVTDYYKEALSELVKFQTIEGLDYSVCTPRNRFDRQSMMWDMHHFKYFFLKISGLPFNEQALEDDFQSLASLLEEADSEYFMFRDFQSRNIMIHNDKCYFIDYQGGRHGGLQYDPASILFEAKTNLPIDLREELLVHYLDELQKQIGYDRQKFLKHYYLFVLIRLLQAMGTYGLRGWVEKKPLFLQSVPYAVTNLKWLINNKKLPENLTGLNKVLEDIAGAERFKPGNVMKNDKLCVRITSFSYKKTLPDDLSGNGGGFVFDCRAIHNPGRYEEYRNLTGKDPEVQKFFAEKSEMGDFLVDIYRIIDRSVESYLNRSYKNLQVSFGCTGGQHRSVFAAEKLAAHLQQNDKLIVELLHRELE